MTKEELEKHDGPVWALVQPLSLPWRWDSWEISDSWEEMVLSPVECYPVPLGCVFPSERAALNHRLTVVMGALDDWQRHRAQLLARLQWITDNPEI